MFSTGPVLAHKDDYLADTFVYVTLDGGELELEYFLDGHFDPRALGHHFGAEYGFTNHLMGDVAARWLQNSGGPTFFHEGFVEVRYRFGEENQYIVDPAVSLEYHFEKDPDTAQPHHLLEPRLVLSKDFGGCNLTLNVSYAVDLDTPKASAPEFAVGFRSPAFGPFQAGLELRRELVTENATNLIPQVWMHLSEDAYLKLGVAKNLAGGHESFVRLALEVEF